MSPARHAFAALAGFRAATDDFRGNGPGATDRRSAEDDAAREIGNRRSRMSGPGGKSHNRANLLLRQF